MLYQDLIEALSLYRPALLLQRIAPDHARLLFREVLAGLTILFFAPIFIGVLFNIILFPSFERIFQGLFYISLSLFVFSLLLEAFYNSYRFKDSVPTLSEGNLAGEKVPCTYPVAEIVDRTDPTDLTGGFIRSESGRELLFRLGLDLNASEHFLNSRKEKVSGSGISFPGATKVALSLYAEMVIGADKEFSQFLFSLSIQEKEFIGAALWVSRLEERRNRRARFWSKDNLGRFPGIGKTWGYGQIFTLKRFAEELSFGVSTEESTAKKEVEELEAILAKSREANALIVADQGSGEMDILLGLVGKIKDGTILPALEGKQVFSLDGDALIDVFGEKTAFEKQLVVLMNEAVRAGNIILVFRDLPSFIESSKTIGADLSSLLYPYLKSSSVQIVAIADKNRFHENIERNAALMNSFEVLKIEEKDEASLIAILEDETLRIEAKTGLFFTYQAIQAIAESAARFFSEGVAVDKGRDLLLEMPAVLKREKREVVTKMDVLSLVETKTGVPAEGVFHSDEKEKLLHLEDALHARVIGQNEAISAIANAMRRARAGLSNPNRPLGSFLFLGPTGVGKTETAKALADIFFGENVPMLRLDMSEYAGEDALTRLIGSFEGGRAGVLSSMLRDQKYGVLLLDEFEKIHSKVMDLFLQILDEGFFSDMLGKKVNARNLIIIATSNAGSDLIFQYIEYGKDLAGEKDSIIDAIIHKGQFKPELLNRFDGVILFHPLQEEELKKIAALLIKKFEKRLKEQGVSLQITDDLVNFLVKAGFDRKFGARPMNRVLQENVEELLAEKLIKGEIEKGATVEFVASSGGVSPLEVKIVARGV